MSGGAGVKPIERKFLSSDLITPGKKHRVTLPVIAYVPYLTNFYSFYYQVIQSVKVLVFIEFLENSIHNIPISTIKHCLYKVLSSP